MKKVKKGLKRIAAFALAVILAGTTVDLSTFAVSAAEGTQTVICEHHTEHTADCGYVEAVEGSPCTHVHDETCGDDTVSGNEVCSHVHDEICGYAEAVEGTPCSYVCELCAEEENEEQPENETAECTCGTDDDSIHATNCAVYVAPESPVCTCVEKCTEVNIWCDVCGFDYTQCGGTDTAVPYADCTCETKCTSDNVNSDCTVCSAEGTDLTACTGTDTTTDTTYPYAVVDTAAGTVTIDGTLGGKTTATEEDITALVDAIKGYVDRGITTIIVTGSQPAMITVDGYTVSAIAEAIFRLSGSGNYSADNQYNGKIDLILQDVTEIVGYEFSNAYALKSITLPKVTKLGEQAFFGCYYLETITFGSVVTEGIENGAQVFGAVGEKTDAGDCGLVLNYGQHNVAAEYQPNLETNTWWNTGWKFITHTHTGGRATCTALAVCELCNSPYGEKATDNHTGTLSTYAPTADGSQHFATWDCCNKVETADHTAEPTYTVNEDDNTKHDVYYSCCGTFTEVHSGGEATCTTQGVCTTCGTPYGNLADHSMGYSANQDDLTITYKCATCDTQTVTFTLVIPTGAVYGSSGLEVPHYQCSDTTYSGEYPVITLNDKELKNFVPNAGTYAVTMTWDGQTVSEEYTIAKATPTVSAVPTVADRTFDLHVTLQNSDLTGGTVLDVKGNTLEGTWSWKEQSIVPTVNNAGYEAVFTPADTNYDAVTETIEVNVARATPDIGTVSANPSELQNTLDIDEVELSRSNTTIDGTLMFTDDMLRYGTHTYNWKFTPTNAMNYETITGTVEITVNDTIDPTATYKIGTDGWKQFINTITFGLFCKDYKTVEIEYSDGENGSGVATKQYYISNEEITDTSSVEWKDYTGKISLNATGTYFIYIKVTDNYGNSVILNSEGIVIYADSEISPTIIDYTYKSNADASVQIALNGNTFAKLTDGDGNEIAADNYIIDETGKLTLKAAYLDTLDKGEYTYKIYMNPQDVETTEVTLDHTFTVNVKAKELTVTGATATSRDYNETNTVEITGVTLSGVASGDTVAVDLTGLQGTLSSANAGTYTEVTLPTLTLTGADAGNYTLVQPTGAVATNVTINKLNPTIAVGQTEYNKTFGDADFTLDVTDDNPEADVTYSSSDEDVVTVSNGTVTIKGAGTATITVSLAESANYNAGDDKTITVTVAKATYSVNEINKSYLYSRENADSINLAGLLPTDCGTVSYGIPATTGAVTYKENPSVTDGILSYTLNSGAVDATGTITVVITTQNYENITIKVNVELIDQIPVSVKEGTEVTLKNNTLTYGEALSKLEFNSAVFVDDDGKEVAGTLAWKEPSTTPDAGTTSATWVFTPDNEEYASLEGSVAITVNKATPTVSAVPTVADRVYNPSVILQNSDLTGGTTSVPGTWSWQTANIIPRVDNSGYVAVFTPSDIANYETVTRTITVNVAKATPHIETVPSAADITYGATLGSSALSGGVVQYSDTDNTVVAGSFAWKDASTKPAVSDSNSTAYTVVFTPADTTNYNTVETTITLTVNKAENAPNMPGNTMSAPYSNKTVGAVTLPDGWAWQDADKNTALEVGVSVEATAVYTGTDKGNYENESVVITITRSACEHTNTEVRDAKKATCEETGYTGDTYCKDCGECTATGTEIPLADHKGGTATCTKKAVCSVCGKEYGSVDSSKHGETEIKGYVAATCTAEGYTGDTYCKDCGVKLASGQTTDKLGHDYRSEVTKEPTTTEEGVRTYTCANCKDTYTESIPKLPEDHKHSYTSSVTKEPTCTENGVRTYTCSCGDSYTETIAKTDHDYKSEETKKPTTTEEGEMTYTCLVCGHTYTQPIEKITDDGSDNNEDSKPDTGKPFIKDDKGKEGWDVIRDEVEVAKDGDTVTVDMNGATVVPGDVFNGIKGRDVTIVFDMGNGITWSVNGKDITSDNVGDIDFGVKVGADANNTIPIDVINKVTGERYSMNVSLAYDGEFGFKAVLSLNMDVKNAGLYANLFYFNEQTGELEFICADEIAADGTAELTFTHASEYTVVVDEGAIASSPQMGDTTSTLVVGSDAGDAWWIFVLIAILAVAGVAVYVVYARKKKEKH